MSTTGTQRRHFYNVWYTVLDTSGDADVDLTDTMQVFARSEREAGDQALQTVRARVQVDFPVWIECVARSAPPVWHCDDMHMLKRMG